MHGHGAAWNGSGYVRGGNAKSGAVGGNTGGTGSDCRSSPCRFTGPTVHRLRVITPPDQVISPLLTLLATPQPDPLKVASAMPEDIMESELTPPEKAAGVEDIEMADMRPTAQAAAAAVPAAGAAAVLLGFAEAAAAIKVDVAEEEDEELVETQATTGATGDDEEDSESSEAEELTTRYHPVISSVAGLDGSWLTVLKSYDVETVLPTRYRNEAFEQWHKVNDKAVEINAELAARNLPPLLPTRMFPQVYAHLSNIGMNMLTDREHETGHADDDLEDRVRQSAQDHEAELRRDAQERKVEQTRRLKAEKAERDRKKAAEQEATPGQEEAGEGVSDGPLMANNIVMPMFPLQLGQVLAQRTDYNEIDVLERGCAFLHQDMPDSEITTRVIALRDQVLSLVCDEKQVTNESWGRLSVFGLKPDLLFLQQFFKANQGRNRLALALIAKEARARVILREMAQVGVLRLAPGNFVIW